MRRRGVILLLILFVGLRAGLGAEKIVIPLGVRPDLDGKAREEEWIDAAEIYVSIEDKVTVRIRMKHDQTNLYLAFYFKDNGDRVLVFPELLVDPDHDRSARWAEDDWWFHISGTDCEARGTFSDYSHCRVDHPDWKGIPNYELSENPPPVKEIEMMAPLAKLGVKIDRPFGMAVSVEVVPDQRVFWPEDAALESPSTWGTAVLGVE